MPDLLAPLADHFRRLTLFRYITFRTGGATITALIISLLCGPAFIRWLKTHQAEGQPIRDDGPEIHLITKIGTPTMGGLLILIALCGVNIALDAAVKPLSLAGIACGDCFWRDWQCR